MPFSPITQRKHGLKVGDVVAILDEANGPMRKAVVILTTDATVTVEKGRLTIAFRYRNGTWRATSYGPNGEGRTLAAVTTPEQLAELDADELDAQAIFAAGQVARRREREVAEAAARAQRAAALAANLGVVWHRLAAGPWSVYHALIRNRHGHTHLAVVNVAQRGDTWRGAISFLNSEGIDAYPPHAMSISFGTPEGATVDALLDEVICTLW